jgi:serine/threonine-protein kinase
VVAKIAGGGLGAVYLGRRVDPDVTVPSVVALKIVRHEAAKDSRFVQMFLEEGRLLARLVHPNIVRTLEVGADEEQDFIAMELMLGKTFSSIHEALVARNVRLNPEIAAWSAARIAEALHYAHELADEYGRPLALVHRDVNPANVFATFNGEVKLFDFGLAKVTADEPSGSKIVAGKLSYLSPEQIMQMPLDRRSDVFSLGTTLWELLTSRRLFRRDSDIETVRAVQLGPIPDIRAVASELPAELARIVRTALERNRDHRYPTCAHIAAELDAYVYARSSPEDLRTRLAQLVGTLFPDEHKRQSGWLKPAITSSISKAPPAPNGGTARPPPPSVRRDSRETTAVMAHAPIHPHDEGLTLSTPVSAMSPTARDGAPSVRPPPSRTAPPPLSARPPSLQRTGWSSPPPVSSPPPPSAATARASRRPEPPPTPRQAPAAPPTRTDVQSMPPAPESKPTVKPDRESNPLHGMRGAPLKRAPIPLPSRARGDSLFPPRPGTARPATPPSVMPPKPSVPPPPATPRIDDRSRSRSRSGSPEDADTTEVEALPDDGHVPEPS